MKDLSVDRRDFLKFSAAAFLGGCATSGRGPLDDDVYSGQLLLINCNVVDVEGASVISNASLRIEAGRVRSIEAGQISLNGYEQIIDLGGRYVIPGLIDAHCHTTMSPVWRMRSVLDLPLHLDMMERQCEISVESGITTVRDCGSFPPQLRNYMRRIESGDLLGPRVVYCNSISNIKGGHPSVPPEAVSRLALLLEPILGLTMTNFESEQELSKVLDENTQGASFLKLTVDNETIFCKDVEFPVYTDRMLDMFVEAHQKLGLPIVCHCHRKWGFDRLVNYPVHSFEHMIGDAYLSEADVELMVKKNISIVPTMTVAQSLMNEEAFDEIPAGLRSDFVDQELAERRKYIYGSEVYDHCDPTLHDDNLAELRHYKEMGRENLWANNKFLVNPDLYFGVVKHAPGNLKLLRDAGVNIGCGIDAGMPFTYFGGMYREYEAYARAGFSNAEILRCATINNARILKLEDSIGTLKSGKLADLAVLDGDPLADIGFLKKPVAVFKDGQLAYATGRVEQSADGRYSLI